MSGTSAPAATVIGEENLLQCRYCQVRFGGLPTDPRTVSFRTRHEQVNHNPVREQNVRDAARRTAWKRAQVVEARAAKASARATRLAVEKAKRPTK